MAQVNCSTRLMTVRWRQYTVLQRCRSERDAAKGSSGGRCCFQHAQCRECDTELSALYADMAVAACGNAYDSDGEWCVAGCNCVACTHMTALQQQFKKSSTIKKNGQTSGNPAHYPHTRHCCSPAPPQHHQPHTYTAERTICICSIRRQQHAQCTASYTTRQQQQQRHTDISHRTLTRYLPQPLSTLSSPSPPPCPPSTLCSKPRSRCKLSRYSLHCV